MIGNNRNSLLNCYCRTLGKRNFKNSLLGSLPPTTQNCFGRPVLPIKPKSWETGVTPKIHFLLSSLINYIYFFSIFISINGNKEFFYRK